MTPDIVSLIHDALMAIIAACAPVIAWKLASLVGMQSNANAITVVTNAIDKGASLALDHGQTALDPLLQKAETKSAALKVANDYVVATAGAEAAQLGVGEAALATKVRAVLADKLNVPAVALASAPVTVPKSIGTLTGDVVSTTGTFAVPVSAIGDKTS